MHAASGIYDQLVDVMTREMIMMTASTSLRGGGGERNDQRDGCQLSGWLGTNLMARVKSQHLCIGLTRVPAAWLSLVS